MKLSLFLVLLVAAAAAAKEISVTVDPSLPPLRFEVSDDDTTEATGRSLLSRRRPVKEAPVNTFGWASIFADKKNSADKSCANACRSYNLKAITVPDLVGGDVALCRFKDPVNGKDMINGVALLSATTKTLVTVTGGTSGPNRPSKPINVDVKSVAASVCIGSSLDDSEERAVVESDYTCGCCGTINVKGRVMGTACDKVTDWVAEDATCPANAPNNKAWTSTGTKTGDICRRLTDNLLDVDGNPSTLIEVFGTVVQQDDGLKCFIAFQTDAEAGSWEKLCYQINSYSGPPRTDDKDKGRKML